MKRIRKGHPPVSLTNWNRNNLNLNTHSYDEMRRNQAVLADLSEKLCREQGYICAYTGIEISLDVANPSPGGGFHIEHLYPQNMSRRNGTHEDTDYVNMVACYPKPNLIPSQSGCEFGAVARGNWYDRVLFVPPTDPRCDGLFTYTTGGKVLSTALLEYKNVHNPTTAQVEIFKNNDAASKMIESMNLNHPELIDLRIVQINEYLDKSNKDQILHRIYRPSNGKLIEFCFVIKQILERHV